MFLKTSLRPLVCPLPSFLGIRSLDFSEIWYEGSLIWFLKSDGTGFSKINYMCPQWPFKGVFFTVFLAFLGVRSLDFSDFRHEGSMTWFLKIDEAGFLLTIFCQQ